MKKQNIEQQILELKHDYVRIQGDIEKLESTGIGLDKAEQQLIQIETKLAELRNQLTSFN